MRHLSHREYTRERRDFVSAFLELQQLEARKRIKDELLNYCVVTEAPKTTFGKIRKTYTGKLYGKQDDLAIALQLAMIGAQKFFQDPKVQCASNITFAFLLLTTFVCNSTATSAWTITSLRKASPTTRGRRASRRSLDNRVGRDSQVSGGCHEK